jgi:ATP-dependent Clp protease ATP-binding subunit ClpA
MADLEIFTDKIAESGRVLIRKSYDEAKRRTHNQILPEHILVAIAETESPFFNQVMQSLNLDPQVVLQALETRLKQYKDIGRNIKMSEPFRTLLSDALQSAHRQNRRFIESTDMFRAIFMSKHSACVNLFEQLGADSETILEKIEEQIRHTPTDSQPPTNQRGHL